MNSTLKYLLIVLLINFCPSIVSAFDQPSALDKSNYTIFDPTPYESMREMSTDRPDKTESPYTVDAGHIQVETSLVDYTQDTHNPEGSQEEIGTINAVESNLKIGLNNNMDLQLVFSPYIYEKTSDDTEETIKQGFGDTQMRLKVNVWGNDEGNTALGVMPFIKFPTNGANLGNNAYEGGIIVPLGIALPNDWNMGLMAEFDFNRNKTDKDYHTEFIQSITFSHAILGSLSGYIEFFSNTSDETDVSWLATVDGGLTYAVSKDIQFDAGVNMGVTRSADDINPFFGLSIRH